MARPAEDFEAIFNRHSRAERHFATGAILAAEIIIDDDLRMPIGTESESIKSYVDTNLVDFCACGVTISVDYRKLKFIF